MQNTLSTTVTAPLGYGNSHLLGALACILIHRSRCELYPLHFRGLPTLLFIYSFNQFGVISIRAWGSGLNWPQLYWRQQIMGGGNGVAKMSLP